MSEPMNKLKECRHGPMLFNIHDRYIGRSLDLYGEWSEKEVEVFGQLVHPGFVVVEVGANIGAHTVPLAKLVGTSGKVIAFEPQRIVFQTLCANVALSSLTNVECLQKAVGALPGRLLVPQLDFHVLNNFGGLGLGNHNSGEPVDVITLDSLALPRCDFLKIDVEGMEEQVLQGAAATLERCRPVLYVENDRQEKSDALIRAIDRFGYTMFWHLPTMFNPKNFFGNTHNEFSGIASRNMLCVHNQVPSKINGFTKVEVPVTA